MPATVEETARALNLSVRRVQQLAKEPGFPPKPTRGAYDLGKVALWYVRFLSNELERRGPAADSQAITQAKFKLVGEQATRLEMYNAETRGELLAADDVRIAWTSRLVNFQRRLRAIPSSLGPQLVNKSDAAYIAGRVLHEINIALEELNGIGKLNED